MTAEVSPHHLLLIDEDIPADEGFWKMNPPLRGQEDREALIEGLLDGTIDCIATDHAPHGYEEKCKAFKSTIWHRRIRICLPIVVHSFCENRTLYLAAASGLDDRETSVALWSKCWNDDGRRQSRPGNF